MLDICCESELCIQSAGIGVESTSRFFFGFCRKAKIRGFVCVRWMHDVFSWWSVGSIWRQNILLTTPYRRCEITLWWCKRSREDSEGFHSPSVLERCAGGVIRCIDCFWQFGVVSGTLIGLHRRDLKLENVMSTLWSSYLTFSFLVGRAIPVPSRYLAWISHRNS